MAGQRVLIVDQDPALRRMLARILSRTGQVAFTLSPAELTGSLIREAQPSLIVADAGLDLPTGTRYRALLAEARRTMGLTLVLMADAHERALQEATVTCDAAGYFTKRELLSDPTMIVIDDNGEDSRVGADGGDREDDRLAAAASGSTAGAGKHGSAETDPDAAHAARRLQQILDDEIVQRQPTPRGPRVECDLQVTLHREHNFFVARIGNISVGGLFVETAIPESVGARLGVELVMPDGHRMQTMAEVVWSRSSTLDKRPLPLGMGLRFLNMTLTDARRIEHLIRERAPLLFDIAGESPGPTDGDLEPQLEPEASAQSPAAVPATGLGLGQRERS